MAILRNPATGDDPPPDDDDDPPRCPVHGGVVEDDGYCDACWLAAYDTAHTWDDDDEADARYDRWREQDD